MRHTGTVPPEVASGNKAILDDLHRFKHDDVQAITDMRKSRYGDFRGHATASQRLKEVTDDALAENPNFAAMSVSDRHIVKEGLAMILHKIARIVNGDPTYDDSWLDIEGYSKITRERVCKGE